MAKNHQLVQTKQQETYVQIPINIATTLINHTGNSNQKPNHWPTIILCVIFVITGQSITKLLENFYYHQTNQRQNDVVWTQSLLPTVGFPILLLPYFIFTAKNQNQQTQITSADRSSTRFIISLSGSIGILMSSQGRFSSKAKLEIPFRVFTLIYTTQLFFTSLLVAFFNKIKFNGWIVISLILAISTGALTSTFSFPDETEQNYAKESRAVLLPGVNFCLLLFIIQYAFKRTEPSFRLRSHNLLLLRRYDHLRRGSADLRRRIRFN